MGGRDEAKNVLDEVERKVRHLLKDVDYELLRDNRTPRWKKNMEFARYVLVRNGLLKGDSVRGIWALTEQGVAEVEKNEG
jgi:hypothetical protein